MSNIVMKMLVFCHASLFASQRQNLCAEMTQGENIFPLLPFTSTGVTCKERERERTCNEDDSDCRLTVDLSCAQTPPSG